MSAPATLPKALPPALCALAGLLVAVVAWHDVQRMASGARPGGAPATVATAAVDAPPPGPDTRAGLPGLALFGQAATTAPPENVAPPVPVALDETRLPASEAGYQLFGLIEAERQDEARAILGSADGQQQEYRVGDTMPDGARVHAIRARAVLFERNGELERLALPEPDAGSAASAVGGALPNNLPGRVRVAVPGMNGMPSRFSMPRSVPPQAAVPDLPPDLPSAEPMAPEPVPDMPPDVPMDPEPVAE